MPDEEMLRLRAEAKAEAIRAVAALMPRGFALSGTLDEMVEMAGKAADEAALGAVMALLAERGEAIEEKAPECDQEQCRSGRRKKKDVFGSSPHTKKQS